MDCNLGSEIGQKMRSAVKAKLLELGTGGSSGFIDDELPDYVMVMVANKRTKQQMNAELNLFLGEQTDLFVTWLHEVLQKLQEVTLPTSSAANKKRKSRQTELAGKAKDKKSTKKDKKGHRKSGDGEPPTEPSTSTTEAAPVIGSITDVFAEELLEKAKKTLDVDTHLKDEILQKKKKRKADEVQAGEEAATQDFDMPTMSEISSTTAGQAQTAKDATAASRDKDLAELEELQRKIQAAKQHLRQIGELDEDDSDGEDGDFLNLNAQDETASNEFEAEAPSSHKEATPRRVKSPIVFNRRTKTPEPMPVKEKPAEPEPKPREREVPESRPKEERNERRSVHERLGLKPQTSERPSRSAKELYVPAHRRRSEQEPPERSSGRSRENSRKDHSRERRSSRERERGDSSREVRSRRRSSSAEAPQPVVKQRIGSRVIVAPHKPPPVSSDDEDLQEKPVNSVIKIKPRPQVSPRRQACKNLLMRAVADAQRSTILAKPAASVTSAALATSSSSSKRDSDEPELISSTLGKRKANESSSKAYREPERERERSRRAAPGNELFRRSTRELVVNVLHRDAKRSRRSNEARVEIREEEYMPTLGISDYTPYVPQLVDDDGDIDMHIKDEDDEDDAGANGKPKSSVTVPKTQFVVTLNGDKALENYRKRSSASRKRSPSPSAAPQVSSSSAYNSTEPSSSSSGIGRRRRELDSHSPTLSNTPPPLRSRSHHHGEALRQEVKKIIIKNDTDEDDEMGLHPVTKNLPNKRSPTKRQSRAANGHTKLEEEQEKEKEQERSTTPPLPPQTTKKTLTPGAVATTSEKRSSSRDRQSSGAGVQASPVKSKHTPIRFTLKNEEEPPQQQQQPPPPKKRRSDSRERDTSTERRKISIRTAEDKKYDNLPALSAVSVDSTALKVAVKPKERCKYHPNCTKQFCDYYHPSAPCKAFPNCKYADKCMYSHPKCKFDMSCMSVDCNFAHSGARDLSHSQLQAPPLSSHVIPVQNYKSISAPVTTTTATTMCKYYPNCTKVGCTFYHPKPCRYGKNCINKLECIFYHPEMQSKFKWVASLG